MSSSTVVLPSVLPFNNQEMQGLIISKNSSRDDSQVVQECEKVNKIFIRLFEEISKEPLDKEVYEECRKQLKIIENSPGNVFSKEKELVLALKILPSKTLDNLEKSCQRRIEDIFFKKIVVLAIISQDLEGLYGSLDKRSIDKRSIDESINYRLQFSLKNKDYKTALEMANIMSDKEMRKESIISIIKSFLRETISQRGNSSEFDIYLFIEKLINEKWMLQKIEAIAISRELEEVIDLLSLTSIQELVIEGVILLKESEAEPEKEPLQLDDLRKLAAFKKAQMEEGDRIDRIDRRDRMWKQGIWDDNAFAPLNFRFW